MTSDDHDSPTKPQVIDLEAEDITPAAEQAAAQPDPKEAPRQDSPPPRPAPPQPPRPKSRGTTRWWAAAVILAAIGGAWAYRDVLANYFPTATMTALGTRLDALEVGSRTQADQLVTVSTAIDEARRAAAAALKDAATANEASAGFDKRLSADEIRFATLEKSIAATRAEIEQLRAALTSAGTGNGNNTGTVDPGALAAIAQRLDALEKDVASLKAGGATGDDATLVNALRQSLSDLTAKVAAGLPYRDELARILREVPALGTNDVLKAYAENGLPNPKGLAAELRAAIPALPKPEAPVAPAEQGYLDSIWNALTSIVTIRDVGDTDWPALAESSAILAETGDLPGAIAGIDAAQGSLPPVLSQWRDRAASRIRLEAALLEAAKAVALQIAARGGGQ